MDAKHYFQEEVVILSWCDQDYDKGQKAVNKTSRVTMGNHHSTTCTENNRDYQSKGTLEPSDVKPGSYLHEADKDYQSNGTLECVPSEVQLRSYSDEAVEGMVSDYQSKGTLECVPSEVQLRSYSDEAVESMVSGYQSKGALEHVPGNLEMVSCSAGGMVSGSV